MIADAHPRRSQRPQHVRDPGGEPQVGAAGRADQLEDQLLPQVVGHDQAEVVEVVGGGVGGGELLVRLPRPEVGLPGEIVGGVERGPLHGEAGPLEQPEPGGEAAVTHLGDVVHHQGVPEVERHRLDGHPADATGAAAW